MKDRAAVLLDIAPVISTRGSRELGIKEMAFWVALSAASFGVGTGRSVAVGHLAGPRLCCDYLGGSLLPRRLQVPGLGQAPDAIGRPERCLIS
jgi:hypothetical protein